EGVAHEWFVAVDADAARTVDAAGDPSRGIDRQAGAWWGGLRESGSLVWGFGRAGSRWADFGGIGQPIGRPGVRCRAGGGLAAPGAGRMELELAEVAMHPLVAAIVLGTPDSRSNQPNPKRDEPDGQCGQSTA